LVESSRDAVRSGRITKWKAKLPKNSPSREEPRRDVSRRLLPHPPE
jgi:hypothetical protein